MKLCQLFSFFSELQWGDTATQEVSSLAIDSRQVDGKSVFIAIRGTHRDGHNYLSEVCHKGAVAVVVENTKLIPQNYRGAVVKVEDTRKALNELCRQFYHDPAKNLFCVGVTGTNGKTSFTYLLECIFNEYKWPTGVLGTVDHHLGEHRWTSQLTTPDSITLHRRLSEFVALGAKAAVFEVSSHALAQQRADFIPFACGVFTNLTRDHLDYHKDMEDYFLSKQRLFLEVPYLQNKTDFVAIINKDDVYGKKLRVADFVRTLEYGKKNNLAGDFTFQIQALGFSETRILVQSPSGEAEISLPFPGEHNAYNALAAIAVAHVAGISLQTCRRALEKFSGIPGRLMRVGNASRNIFVDYAHTSDALYSVLKTLSEIRQKQYWRELSEPMPTGSVQKNNYPKLITLFGCGGDRDRGKRPLMRKAAEKFSDMIFITSDNPRTEDPQKIIEDIMEGVDLKSSHHKIIIEVDRRKAIEKALLFMSENDILLIAGKGHEDYQEIHGQRFHFNDKEVVEELVEETFNAL